MNRIDYEAWAIFASVAKYGSFTATAEYYNLSKPTVSKTISRLEQQIGAVLFHRSSRSLSLSASGKTLLPYAQKIIDDGQAAMEAAIEETQQFRGVVKIAAPLSYGLSALSPLLMDFMNIYPDIMIDLRLSDAQVDIIDEEFDLALRIGSLHDSSLLATKICDIKAYFIASPNYIERYGLPNSPKDLAQHRTLIYANSDSKHQWKIYNIDDKSETIVQNEQNFACNNGDMILSGAIAGQGIAYLPEFLCGKALKDNKLIHLLPDYNMGEMALYFITPPSRHRPARLRILMEYLKKHIGG